jgi:hypothetical protein
VSCWTTSLVVVVGGTVVLVGGTVAVVGRIVVVVGGIVVLVVGATVVLAVGAAIVLLGAAEPLLRLHAAASRTAAMTRPRRRRTPGRLMTRVSSSVQRTTDSGH